MRTIDADALREAVESHVTSVSVCATAEQARGRTDFKKLCLKDIDEAPTVGGWISVKDRLPELATLALVCDASSGKMAVARYIANNQWVLPAFFPAVTHWAPLPEAPKEDVDDA